MVARLGVVLSVVVALGAARAASAEVTVYQSDRATVGVGAMVQVLGLGQDVADPVRNDVRAYLFMKEARFRLTGDVLDIRYRLELGMGPEDALATTSGIGLGLLDLNADVPLFGSKSTYVRVGQMKVPYGREQLEYSGAMPFGSRSITNLGFKVGRDVGAGLFTQPGKFLGIIGVWTGGGRDVPPDHYLPQNLGFPLLAARVGYGDADGLDPLRLDADALAVPDHARFGVYLNGLYTHDSQVGHSTVLNVKLADKSLLLDSNWNPYIAAAPFAPGDWWQLGGDAVLRIPVGAFALSGEVQGDWAGYANRYGVLHLAGGRGQLSVARGPFEVAARYAVLFPDENLQANGQSITHGDPMHEVTPSLTWHLRDRNLQLTADLPLLFHVPVFTETGVGSYVGTELPDESALIGKKGQVAAQNVVEARLMFQAQF